MKKLILIVIVALLPTHAEANELGHGPIVNQSVPASSSRTIKNMKMSGELCVQRSADLAFNAGAPLTHIGGQSDRYITAVYVSDRKQWAGFPGLAKTADGRIIMLYSYGTEHQPPHMTTHTVCQTYSSDGGKTWTTPTLTYQSRNRSHGAEMRDLVRLSDGKLMAIGFYEDNSYASHGAFTLTSSNDGATWFELNTIDDGTHTLATGICQMANGTVLAAVGRGAGTGINEIAVRSSSDSGATWGSAVVVVRGGTNWISRLLPLDNGNVMLVYASSTGIYQKTSIDNGATWGPAVTITKSATTLVGAGQFSDGKIVTVAPSNIMSNRPVYMVSADNGATWSSPVLLEDQDSGVHQCSALLETSPGQMVVAYGKRLVASGFGDIRVKLLTSDECARALSGHIEQSQGFFLLRPQVLAAVAVIGGLVLLLAGFSALRHRSNKQFPGLRKKL